MVGRGPRLLVERLAVLRRDRRTGRPGRRPSRAACLGLAIFPDATINFAENVLRRRDGAVAMHSTVESGAERAIDLRRARTRRRPRGRDRSAARRRAARRPRRRHADEHAGGDRRRARRRRRSARCGRRARRTSARRASSIGSARSSRRAVCRRGLSVRRQVVRLPARLEESSDGLPSVREPSRDGDVAMA